MDSFAMIQCSAYHQRVAEYWCPQPDTGSDPLPVMCGNGMQPMWPGTEKPSFFCYTHGWMDEPGRLDKCPQEAYHRP